MQGTDVLQVSGKAWRTPRGCCVFNNVGRGNVRMQQLRGIIYTAKLLPALIALSYQIPDQLVQN